MSAVDRNESANIVVIRRVQVALVSRILNRERAFVGADKSRVRVGVLNFIIDGAIFNRGVAACDSD